MNLAFLKKVTFQKKGKQSKAFLYNEIHAHHDWKKIIYTFFVLALVVSATNIYLFLSYHNKIDFTVPAAPVVSSQKLSDLEKVEVYLEARQGLVKPVGTTSSSTTLVDPSR